MLPGISGKQAAGIALLGVAFAWAIGSDSRVVHWLFVALGMALLVYSTTFYSTARLDIPQHASLDYTATVNGQTVRWDLDNGKWIPAARRNDPPFSLVMDYFWLETWWLEVPGVLLLVAGVGLVIGVKPRSAKNGGIGEAHMTSDYQTDQVPRLGRICKWQLK